MSDMAPVKCSNENHKFSENSSRAAKMITPPPTRCESCSNEQRQPKVFDPFSLSLSPSSPPLPLQSLDIFPLLPPYALSGYSSLSNHLLIEPRKFSRKELRLGHAGMGLAAVAREPPVPSTILPHTWGSINKAHIGAPRRRRISGTVSSQPKQTTEREDQAPNREQPFRSSFRTGAVQRRLPPRMA